MMELSNIQRIYFIGIGGIGMSAIARYFHSKGKHVSGYDKTPTKLTETLQQEGINIVYHDDESGIDKAADVVVYTPAIPANHLGLNWYQQNQFTVLKRSDVLQLITQDAFSICIAGTHGKTSITTLVAHILTHSGYGCNAFLGGIAANYNSNYWSHERKVCVVEADEYDRSFLKLSPDIAVISAMDPDHLDIYGTPEAVDQAFADFSRRLKPGGTLIHKQGLAKASLLQAPHIQTYDRDNENADSYAYAIQLQQGGYRFNVKLKDTVLEEVVLPMGGLHNVENIT
ncbi:MAG: UDP-N-acetylmuramate--L-alanine ligase, partial [Bacteroidetes bacterium]